MIKQVKWLVLALGLLLTSAVVAAPAHHNNLQSVLNQLQMQIHQVQANVPKQIRAQAVVTNKQIQLLQKATQKEITLLQRQIQQVQTTLNQRIKVLQKELREEEMIK